MNDPIFFADGPYLMQNVPGAESLCLAFIRGLPLAAAEPVAQRIAHLLNEHGLRDEADGGERDEVACGHVPGDGSPEYPSHADLTCVRMVPVGTDHRGPHRAVYTTPDGRWHEARWESGRDYDLWFHHY